MKVGNSFGLLAIPRTCVEARYIAACACGGAANVTAKVPSGRGKTRLAVTAEVQDTRRSIRIGSTGLASGWVTKPLIVTQPALLVLDNMEHLMAGGTAFVRELLTRLPTLTLLITSRQRLGLDGETHTLDGAAVAGVEATGWFKTSVLLPLFVFYSAITGNSN